MSPQQTDTDNPNDPQNEIAESDSLEAAPSQSEVPTIASPDRPSETVAQKPAGLPKGRHFGKLGYHVNIYLLLFFLIILIGIGAAVVSMFHNRDKDSSAQVFNQSISDDTLKQLTRSDTTIGDSKQVLSVQSNAVFAGKVLVRDDLDVAGTIRVSGALSLPGVSVSGDSTFDQVVINKALAVNGDGSIQGQLTVRRNLSVSGGGTFGGAVSASQITTSQLQILNNLTLTSHIIAGGATPGRTQGGALGAGGTASISGSDTGGTININTGGGPAAGCFLTVNFSSRYSSTPRVILSPTTVAAADIRFYATRSTSGFSVCTVSTPPAGSSIGFDYIVFG